MLLFPLFGRVDDRCVRPYVQLFVTLFVDLYAQLL